MDTEGLKDTVCVCVCVCVRLCVCVFAYLARDDRQRLLELLILLVLNFRHVFTHSVLCGDGEGTGQQQQGGGETAVEG